MQKKIIALAVAALASTAAFAQTNVTIYGIADASVSATTNLGATTGQTGFKVNTGTLSTSRIGFKGVEDLGNGLKALFTLEYGLAIDDNTGIGTGTNIARQQFVGLTGGFGTVIAGRLQTTGLDFTVAGSALGGSAPLGATNVATATAGTGLINGTQMITGLYGRQSNAVAYVSPSFGGVVVAYNHARITEAALSTNTTDSHGDLISVGYDNGPISAGAIYTKATMANTLANDNLKEWGLRAGYDFKVVKLQATYQQAKSDDTATYVGKDKKWVVSATVPIGAKLAVIGEFASLSVDSTAANDDVKVGTLATTYALSKRTTAYAAFVAKRSQDLNADTNTYALGLRHAF
ncbi:MAG: porin [Betaproteobacteria bacterium]|nr:porin [Betaproteobacteria bacterium]